MAINRIRQAEQSEAEIFTDSELQNRQRQIERKTPKLTDTDNSK